MAVEIFVDASQLPDDEDILNAYLQASLAHMEQEVPWPFDAFQLLISRDPERAWQLIRKLVGRAPDSLLPAVGASVLEEFVSRHGLQYVGEIERQAAIDGRFTEALGNIWLTRGAFPPGVEARLVKASQGGIEVLDGVED